MNNDSRKTYESVFGKSIQFINDAEKKEINLVLNEIRKINDIHPECSAEHNEFRIVNFFDSPDLFVVFEKFVLGIEHFEISSSKLTRKGFKYKKKYNEDFIQKIHKDVLEGNSNHSRHVETVSTDLKYEYLLENFYTFFDKHYKNIDRYKENIKASIEDKTKPIYIIFFVEYPNTIPSQIYENEHVIDIYPHMDIRFYEFLNEKNDIIGIIVNYDNGRKENYINRYISINAKKQNLYKIDNKDIFDIRKTGVYDHKNPLMRSSMFKIEP